jgi:L-ribulose-5-phosphate 3-epimerase
MRLGWSTNSIDGDPLAAVADLAAIGFYSLAITPDCHVLNPFADGYGQEVARWQSMVQEHGLTCVIETGARFLLDPRLKHEPTLVSPRPADRERRRAFLVQGIDLAVSLEASCLSLWSGAARDTADEETLWERLVDGLEPVIDHAVDRGIPLGFEPEPGMFIDTLARFTELAERLGRPEALRLTVDIGHMECMGERPLVQRLRPHASRLVNVHLDDMVACVHEHLPLGHGEISFPEILGMLEESGYTGGVHAELPRQAHRWRETAEATAAFIRSHGWPGASRT